MERHFMEHPTYEELLAHIEGTSSAAAAKILKEHLVKCSQCSAEVDGWRRTIQKLQSHEWPRPQVRRRAVSGLMLKWAAAAALIFGVGFGLGRFSEPGTVRLKQSIVAQVTQKVREELKADLLASVGQSNLGATDSFSQQFRRELAAAQEENQRTMLGLFNQLRQEHEADYFSLRHDLETAASVADNDLKQNQQQLYKLASTLVASKQE
jgi:hypothetical protein